MKRYQCILLCSLLICLAPSCSSVRGLFGSGTTVLHALPDSASLLSPLAAGNAPLTEDVTFSPNRFYLSTGQQQRLEKEAVEWKKSAQHLVIAGFAAPGGLPDHARVLAQRRAEAVRSLLIKAGLDPSHLHATAYGHDIVLAKPQDVVRIYRAQ